jgi:hypothetical protein
MQIALVQEGRRGNDRVVRMCLGLGSKFVELRLVDHGVLFEPAYFAVGRLYLVETTVVLDHLKPLAVMDVLDMGGDHCDAITQICMLGNHIHILLLAARVQVSASGEKNSRQQGRQTKITGELSHEAKGAEQVLSA